MAPTNNPWFAATLGLAGLIVGYVVANGVNGLNLPSPQAAVPPTADAGEVPVPPPSNDTPADIDDDAVLGEEGAPVTIIEFTDYQCPFCSRHYEQTFVTLKKDYIDTGKVNYVVRDFPLGFHPHAQKAAEAAECAGDQDNYFAMHEKLFADQEAWANATDAVPVFKGFAEEIGLDTGDFNTCLDDGTFEQEAKDDMAAGSQSGIDGTPGFWILGPDDQSQKISGAYPYDTFKAAIDGMLE